MQKTILFSLMLLLLGGSTRAEDTSIRDFTLGLATVFTGPLAYCAYKAACGSKPAKTTLKFAAYVFSLGGTFGISLFGVANPGLSPLERSYCAAAAVLCGISTCVSVEMFANEFQPDATPIEETLE
jgi:hypothetical protein